MFMDLCSFSSDLNRIRTGVARMRTWSPEPLDDEALKLCLPHFLFFVTPLDYSQKGFCNSLK